MLTLLGITASVITIIGVVIFLSCWFAHLTMTSSDTDLDKYGWASYSDFKREFDKVIWSKRQEEYPTSYFSETQSGRYYDSYIHAGVICFDKNGMLLDIVSYARFCWFSYKNRYYIPRNTHKW